MVLTWPSVHKERKLSVWYSNIVEAWVYILNHWVVVCVACLPLPARSTVVSVHVQCICVILAVKLLSSTLVLSFFFDVYCLDLLALPPLIRMCIPVVHVNNVQTCIYT